MFYNLQSPLFAWILKIPQWSHNYSPWLMQKLRLKEFMFFVQVIHCKWPAKLEPGASNSKSHCSPWSDPMSLGPPCADNLFSAHIKVQYLLSQGDLDPFYLLSNFPDSRWNHITTTHTNSFSNRPFWNS
jgi:hypothetical protein